MMHSILRYLFAPVGLTHADIVAIIVVSSVGWPWWVQAPVLLIWLVISAVFEALVNR